MTTFLTGEVIGELMSQFLEPDETILKVAQGFAGEHVFVAFTDRRVIMSHFSTELDPFKIEYIPPDKFEKKARSVKRWIGLRLLPAETPRVKNAAEFSQYLSLTEDVCPFLDDAEKLLTVGMTRDDYSFSSEYQLVGFTADRIFVLEMLLSGKWELSYSMPLSRLEECGVVINNELAPIEVPLFSIDRKNKTRRIIDTMLHFKDDRGLERKMLVTNLFGQLQMDYPGGAGGGLIALAKAARVIKIMIDQKQKDITPRTTTIGTDVLSLVDRLVGLEKEISGAKAGTGQYDSASRQALQVRRDIASMMPNLIEGVDGGGAPLLADPGECRKQAKALMADR